jgi:hypothetical protein
MDRGEYCANAGAMLVSVRTAARRNLLIFSLPMFDVRKASSVVATASPTLIACARALAARAHPTPSCTPLMCWSLMGAICGRNHGTYAEQR